MQKIRKKVYGNRACPSPASPPQVLRMPLRLIEAQYGSGNFDDAGDDIFAMLNGMSSRPGQFRFTIEFDCAHPNPWYHVMVCQCEALPVEMYMRLRSELERKGLLET